MQHQGKWGRGWESTTSGLEPAEPGREPFPEVSEGKARKPVTGVNGEGSVLEKLQ